MINELIEQLGESFRGLWTSVIWFDSHDTVMKEKEWSVTYLCKEGFVETPGKKTPEEALQFAINMIERHG